MSSSGQSSGSVIIDFAGEVHRVESGDSFVIGRDGDLVIDDNPSLHRSLLLIEQQGGFFWLTNTGTRLTASLTSADGLLEATLAPGAQFPLVVPELLVRFTAGSTLYELCLTVEDPPLRPVVRAGVEASGTTEGVVAMTRDQRILIVVLAEAALREGSSGITKIPASSTAAARLGWTETKFNRKLDNVCDKLTRAGVRGLKGSVSDLASSRRARLVEYAVSVQLVTAEDLELLEAKV